MVVMKGRKGVVFTLDVIASLVVLVAAIGVVSLLQHSAELPSVQYGNLNSIALDSVAVLEKSKVRDVDSLPVVRDFLASGVLIDEDRNKTVMDVIGSLWAQGNLTMAQNLTESMLKGYLPGKINYEIFMGDTLIYNSTPIANPRTKITASTAVSGYRTGVPTSGYLARAWVNAATGRETKVISISPFGSGYKSDTSCWPWYGQGGNLTFIKSFDLPSNAQGINGTLYLSIHVESGRAYIWVNGILQNFTTWLTAPIYTSINVTSLRAGSNSIKMILTEPTGAYRHSHTHPGLLLEASYSSEKNIDYLVEQEHYERINLSYIEGHPAAFGIFPIDIPAGSRINNVSIHIEGENVDGYGFININDANPPAWSDNTPPLNPVVDMDVTDYVHQIAERNATGETNSLSVYFDMDEDSDCPVIDASGRAAILNTSYIILNYTLPSSIQKYGYMSFTGNVLFGGSGDPRWIGRLGFANGENDLRSAVIDPAGQFAYFGTNTNPGRVVKVRLSDFTRVGAITLNASENNLYSAVIDPAGQFAYFGTGTSAGRVIKVRLSDFTRVGAITLNASENNLYSAVIDPAGQFAYFGTGTSAGRVVQVRLSDFTRVGAITLAAGENDLRSAVIDPAGQFAYFGTNTNPGRVVKVRLSDFTRVGGVTLESGEADLYSAVMAPDGQSAYFGTETSPGRILKVRLSDMFRLGYLGLDNSAGERNLYSAVRDLNGEYAYFGTGTNPGNVVKIKLEGNGDATVKEVDWAIGNTDIVSTYLHIAQITACEIAAAAWHNPESTPIWNEGWEHWSPASVQIFKSPTLRNVPSSIYVRLDRLAKNTTNHVLTRDGFDNCAPTNAILPNSTIEYTVLAPGVVGYGDVFNTSSEATSDALARLAALVAPYDLTYNAATESSNIAGISWLWSPTRLKVVVGA